MRKITYLFVLLLVVNHLIFSQENVETITNTIFDTSISNILDDTFDYKDSQGTIIWDSNSDSDYNHNINGIGRDDALLINQKQSKNQKIVTDAIGPISGFLSIELTNTLDNTTLKQSSNTSNFNDRAFLVWGHNNTDINLTSSTVNVNLSAGISPSLTTNVSFTAMQRVWKVKETGGNIPKVKVSIPQSTIRNASPLGNYYMFISKTDKFDATSNYRAMSLDENGNLQTDYDFDGTEYITFAFANEENFERSIYFNGLESYIDMEDALNLNASGFTISAWTKRENTNCSIISKRDESYSQGYDFKILNNNRLELSWKNGNTQTITGNTEIPDNEWHHVAAIYDGTTVKLYIDGVEDASGNRTPPTNNSESFFIAAAGNITPQNHFKGHIDEVRIWETALTPHQLRFLMNQEIEENISFVAGKKLPTTITKNDVAAIPWELLAGYYPMTTYTYLNTEDASGNDHQGELKFLDTVDNQTAPLPYETETNGDWTEETTWKNHTIQTLPNALSIVDGTTPINWNIVKINHDVTIDTETVLGRNRQVLGLYIGDDAQLTVDGNHTDTAAGNSLTVSHYLKLDGKIDLEGQSQLIQNTGSDLDPSSSGSLEKDQQGSADNYTYNYWSSPVGKMNLTTNNNSYSVTDVMYDGENPVNFISSGYDGADGSTISIADYWIWKFANHPDYDFSAWQHVRKNGSIFTGEGFTMKGPGSGTIIDQQNYVFLGKPNNGDINLTLNAGHDYLVGNPYPSAINANTFIRDNGPNNETTNGSPLISGTLYYWEHWGGGSHNASNYQGGYATYNFSGGVAAPSHGSTDPNIGTGGAPSRVPGKYIPVSQGFFVIGESSGAINFNNGQREFKMEKTTGADSSVFVRTNDASTSANDDNEAIDERMKFRIGFNSSNVIHRQLLLTIDEATTTGFDWAYDAEIYDNQMDDLFWMIDDEKYTIQGSNEVNPDSVYPLGIKSNSSGLNTIRIDELENVPNTIGVFVHDLENNTYHNLRAGDFQFTLQAGTYLDRFELTFSYINALNVDETKLNTIDVFYNLNTQSIALYNPNFVDVKSIELYSIIGQEITKINDISELDYSEYLVKNLSAGTYILKINTLSGLLSKKVLVK
ncbi:LamG-like jellyroll fold domain-containing protein [Psychroserpens luteus]|uniref:LamG-like jellyroll fold domain-containing protein n=1 Tax=Psychroserpens luteus TaxID=1434066 RepID=A0ABW5ZPE8_9FLAO|nr:LamG-like jellyroll fold domain-containing protein [Psychroserpens luteus]